MLVGTNVHPKEVKTYTRQLIEGERAQENDEKMYYERYMPEKQTSPWRVPTTEPTSTDGNRLNTETYPHPKSMILSPMERFLTISPQEDPHRTLAKTSMAEDGIKHGDFYSEESRTLLLKRRAAELEIDVEEGSFVPSSKALPKPGTGRRRVIKRARRRRSSDVAHKSESSC